MKTEVKRHKRGDVREDGMVFWCYKTRPNYVAESWKTREKFDEQLAKAKAYDRTDAVLKRKREYQEKVRGTPEFLEYQRAWRRNKRASDPIFAVAMRVRSRLGNAMRRGGYKKTSGTAEITGCSFSELCDHIEAHFTSGMSWDNRDEWELDHVIPLASAKTKAAVIALSHYTNFQPLWKEDNRSKGDKILN